MAGEPKIVTKLGKAESDRILVRDHDLIEELLGKITFSQMTFLMLEGRLPNPGETRMIDALLMVLVEHGMNSSVIAARLTYSTAPESIQGAVAAAIVGAGSVHLGSSEWSAKMLWEALPQGMREADLDTIAASVVKGHMKEGRRIAGIGHRIHPEGDPRSGKLFIIARETEIYGQYCELLQKISQVAGNEFRRKLPVNVTGAIAAIALDMGLPWQMTKTFALVGRTLGAMAHIGEEIQNPISPGINAAIRASLTYETNAKS